MNMHTRSALVTNNQASRIAVPQCPEKHAQADPAPLARRSGCARTGPPAKHARSNATMPHELGKIVHGLLTLHGYVTPNRP